ncbi:hypothetical protein B0T24DRAFT_596132 [Lasiosphaeria ovina]|uniref:DUF7136 domain-containing protein n=1 Tax=Lasiosphaeria ovina TaxID=92902 RepID=A0AAE0K3F8_9PEZI|nr:hypothetical protein B0T24DRAFT_596132 [Lasiosphaeria ovina]
MNRDRLSRRARWLLSALLVAALGPAPAWSAGNATMELDLISPVAGSRYRVNPDTGLAVIIAVQNKAVGDPHKWRFDWTVSSTTRTSSGLLTFADTGSIGTPQSFYQPAVTVQDGDPFIGVSLTFVPSTGKPLKPMPPGDYVFAWTFSIGPWCEFEDRSRTYSISWPINNGSFQITVADDAPWPDLQPANTCASVAGQVSFGPTTQYAATNQATPTTLACVETDAVTEKPDPCRATVGNAAAANISSIMTWSGGDSAGSATAPGTTTTPASTLAPPTGGAAGAGVAVSTRPSSGARLPSSYGLVGFFAVLFCVI